MYDAQQLSPELIEAILALNSQKSQQQGLNADWRRAQLMREMGMQGLQATSPGGGRVGAPNWAGALANIYAAKKAGDIERDVGVRSKNMETQQQAARRLYFESMSGRRMPQSYGYGDFAGEGE